MILVEEAWKIMDSVKFMPIIEEESLFNLSGRILAEDIFSSMNMPPFDKSAMDGYAIFSGDNSKKFRIIETIPAGKFPKFEIKHGECSKIMTGAPLPKGADKVLKIEITEEEGDYMIPLDTENVNNICYLGEDIRTGELLLKKGIKLDAKSIGLIASVGKEEVKVYKKPRVALVTTGTEIVEPGIELEAGQIYNSNAYSIYNQLMGAGAEVEYQGIVGDDLNETEKILSESIENFDAVIISGGVSMGEFDFVPETLEKLGVKIHFNRVAIKPGRPTTFGTIGNKIIFGLPGNPVSTFVITEVFVKPLIYKMAGHKYNPVLIKGRLIKEYKRKKNARDSYIPAIYKDGEVDILEYHGSAHFASLRQANALMLIKRGENEIKKDEIIDVRQI